MFNSLFNDHGLNKPSGMCIRSYNVKLKKCCIDKEFLYTEKYSHAFYFCSFLPCCQYAKLRLMNLKNSNVVNYISLNTIGSNLMRRETFASVYRWAKIRRGENNPLYSTCRHIIFILPCKHYSKSLIRFVYNYCLQYVKI